MEEVNSNKTLKKVDNISETENQTKMSEKENLKFLKAKLTAVKGRIMRAFNNFEPAIDNFAGYDKVRTPDRVMNAIALEIQD